MTETMTYDELQQELSRRTQQDGPTATAAYCRELLDADTLPQNTTRAMLLVHLGEYSEMAGDSAAAGQAFKDAVADGGAARPDARCYLVSWFADHGDQPQSDRIVDEIWAGRPDDPDVHLYLGEHFETHGELPRAIRWYTSGLMRALRSAQASPATVPILLVSRRRARLANGFGEDEFDRQAREAMQKRLAAANAAPAGGPRATGPARPAVAAGSSNPGRHRAGTGSAT